MRNPNFTSPERDFEKIKCRSFLGTRTKREADARAKADANGTDMDRQKFGKPIVLCAMNHVERPGRHFARWFAGVANDGTEYLLVEPPELGAPWVLKCRKPIKCAGREAP